MKRTGTLLILLSFFAAAGALQAGEGKPDPELAKLIPGTWFGYHAAGGGVHRHYIKVGKAQKQGEGQAWRGTGVVWFALPYEQAMDCAFGRPAPRKALAKAGVHAQDFLITLDGEEVTFKGYRARKVFRGGKYIPDTFTAKLEAPGVFCGETSTEHVGHETFHFIKEEFLSKPLPLAIEKGKVHHKIAPLSGDGKYHYSLYLPKNYDHSKPAPLLFNFSPGGGAKPLSPKLADEFGWIMAGATEARNGPSQPVAENLAAALLDMRRRLNLDLKRFYFSGFSGGARMASFAAYTFPGSAKGVICMGAGYSPAVHGTLPEGVAVFFVVGKTDSNHGEVTRLFPIEKRRRKAQMIIHPGGHSWGRKEDQEAAIRWLEEQTKGARNATGGKAGS